jgi:hypothetical protein
MIKQSAISLGLGIFTAITFVSFSLYILFFTDNVPNLNSNDIKLYALLTGSYGIWRFIRVFAVWKEGQNNV